jgi:NTP pyrophosphatase (non-canonical NTP hydrolase)
MSDQRNQPDSGSAQDASRDAGQFAGERPAPLTLGEAQRAVDASILALGGYWPPLAQLARLFEECGELARAVNQTHGPKLVKTSEALGEAREELGDTLYVTLALANSLGVDAEEALRVALDKTARRIVRPPEPPADAAGASRETDL